MNGGQENAYIPSEQLFSEQLFNGELVKKEGKIYTLAKRRW